MPFDHNGKYFRLPRGCVHSRQPLPTRPILEGHLDLTWRQLGTLTVVGLAPQKQSIGQPAAWVVQCACGRFEHRAAQVIRDQLRTPHAMCRACLATKARANESPRNE